MKKLLMMLFVGAAFSAVSAYAACEDTLKVGDTIKFDKTTINIDKTCKTFTINLIHEGKAPKTAMGHNVVIVKTADINAVGGAAAAAGAAKDYVPSNGKVVAASKLIGGGEKTSVTFNVPDSGDYSYVCTFPGHWAVMKGKLVVK